MIRVSARICIITVTVVGAHVEAGRLHLVSIEGEGQKEEEREVHGERAARRRRMIGWTGGRSNCEKYVNGVGRLL